MYAKLDEACIGCNYFIHKYYNNKYSRKRGFCMSYGRGNIYKKAVQTCVCKTCMIKSMCNKICSEAAKQDRSYPI